MNNILLLSLVFVSFFSFSQDEDYAEPRFGQEIAVDGFFSVNTFGGIFDIGTKFGVKFGKDSTLIAGPSLRLQRIWSNVLQQKNSYNIYGGGAFFHARFYNAFFLGAEFEYIHTPFNFLLVDSPKQWVPVFFIGGGYSQAFDSGLRLNVGIMYDLINSVNTPFRRSYLTKKENGVFIPIIYRIALFIPLR
ncbi:MAG: hypothetical protein ACI9G9_001093 [Psychromonas sp.]|jgi:hypothetical protein